MQCNRIFSLYGCGIEKLQRHRKKFILAICAVKPSIYARFNIISSLYFLGGMSGRRCGCGLRGTWAFQHITLKAFLLIIYASFVVKTFILRFTRLFIAQ